MVELFADYEARVLLLYRQKEAINALPPYLARPTPARLRKLCLEVCKEKYSRKDDRMLKTFFGRSGDQATCLQAINEVKIGRFKPLLNFLRGFTGDTAEENIELLAWLIDFPDRPFEHGRKLPISDPVVRKGTEEKATEEQGTLSNEDISGNSKLLPKNNPLENEEMPPENPVTDEGISGKPEPVSKRKIVISLTITICLAAAIIWWPKHTAPTTTWTGNEKCMYWTGDHYEPITCAQHSDTSVVVLDTGKLVHFRKITQPDTITYRSKGAVWYVKVRGNIEFYTSDGFHPTETQLRLRPVTDYIINKYVLANN